jgi:hypothetical protein
MKIRFFYLFMILFSPTGAEEKRSKYFIAIKKNEGNVLSSLEQYEELLPPKGKFYADPFLCKYKGTNYLFFEDFDYKKGVISYVTLDQESHVKKPRKALELPTHLSFPYLFQEGDAMYMVPETFRYRSISLYKAIQFPEKWGFKRVLVQGEFFSDPILFKYNGYYWLFAAIFKDRLVIYHAKDLESPFYPHPINHRLIKGRNAGPVFFMEGRMIRPTMDCTNRYGRSIIFKEILLLDEAEFIEKEIAYIHPNWAPFLEGTHTYGQNEDYVVYDGERLILLSEDALYSSPD